MSRQPAPMVEGLDCFHRRPHKSPEARCRFMIGLCRMRVANKDQREDCLEAAKRELAHWLVELKKVKKSC